MILKQSDFSLTLVSEIFNKLQGLHNNVIQKVSIVGQNLYALQYNNQQDPHNYVYRARKRRYPLFKQVFNASQMAGGHTQTLDFANQPNMWFIGTKKNHFNWSTQLARVTIPSRSAHTSNTEFARLAYLNRAGRGLRVIEDQGVDTYLPFRGNDLLRFDAAISPAGKLLMLVTIDQQTATLSKGNNGYFILYDLAVINAALDKVGIGYVNLGELPYLSEFYINHITAVDKIGSLQGFALDEKRNVYISSEFAPSQGNLSQKPRRIIKIPWGTWGSSNDQGWQILDFDQANIDILGYATELENIQVISENNLYLTISYHNGAGVTTRSRVYQVKW